MQFHFLLHFDIYVDADAVSIIIGEIAGTLCFIVIIRSMLPILFKEFERSVQSLQIICCILHFFFRLLERTDFHRGSVFLIFH